MKSIVASAVLAVGAMASCASAQVKQTPAPSIGWRAPIYDFGKISVNGEPGDYWFFRLDSSQWKVVPDTDPNVKTAGVLTINMPAPVPGPQGVPGPAGPAGPQGPAGASKTYTFGSGFVTSVTAQGDVQVTWDPAYLMRRWWITEGTPPVVGSDCSAAGASPTSMWIGAAGLFVCIPSGQGSGMIWAKAVLQTSPTPANEFTAAPR